MDARQREAVAGVRAFRWGGFFDDKLVLRFRLSRTLSIGKVTG